MRFINNNVFSQAASFNSKIIILLLLQVVANSEDKVSAFNDGRNDG